MFTTILNIYIERDKEIEKKKHELKKNNEVGNEERVVCRYTRVKKDLRSPP